MWSAVLPGRLPGRRGATGAVLQKRIAGQGAERFLSAAVLLLNDGRHAKRHDSIGERISLDCFAKKRE